MKKRRLANGIRKYIRRQKLIIRRLAKNPEQEKRLTRELLDRFYKRIKPTKVAERGES